MKSRSGTRLDVLQRKASRKETRNSLLVKLASTLHLAAGKKLDHNTIVRLAMAKIMENQIGPRHRTDTTPENRSSCGDKNSFRMRVFACEDDYIITYISDKLTQLLGFDQVDIVGRSLFDLMSCDPPQIKSMIDDAFQSDRRDFRVVVDLIAKTCATRNRCTSRTVAISGQIIKLDSGQSVYLDAFVQFSPSRTPRNQMTIVSFRSLHSLDGSFVNCEDSITLVTGYSISEVVGQSAFNYIVQEDQTYAQYLQNLMLKLGEMTAVTYRLWAKNGSRIYLQTEGSPITNHDGIVDRYHCNNRIIEEEEALSEIEKLRTKLKSICISDDDSIDDRQEYVLIDPSEYLHGVDGTLDLSQIEPSISLIDEVTFNLLMSDKNIGTVSRRP